MNKSTSIPPNVVYDLNILLKFLRNEHKVDLEHDTLPKEQLKGYKCEV